MVCFLPFHQGTLIGVLPSLLNTSLGTLAGGAPYAYDGGGTAELVE